MNKQRLIKILESLPENAEILLIDDQDFGERLALDIEFIGKLSLDNHKVYFLHNCEPYWKDEPYQNFIDSTSYA